MIMDSWPSWYQEARSPVITSVMSFDALTIHSIKNQKSRNSHHKLTSNPDQCRSVQQLCRRSRRTNNGFQSFGPPYKSCRSSRRPRQWICLLSPCYSYRNPSGNLRHSGWKSHRRNRWVKNTRQSWTLCRFSHSCRKNHQSTRFLPRRCRCQMLSGIQPHSVSRIPRRIRWTNNSLRTRIPCKTFRSCHKCRLSTHLLLLHHRCRSQTGNPRRSEPLNRHRTQLMSSSRQIPSRDRSYRWSRMFRPKRCCSGRSKYRRGSGTRRLPRSGPSCRHTTHRMSSTSQS